MTGCDNTDSEYTNPFADEDDGGEGGGRCTYIRTYVPSEYVTSGLIKMDFFSVFLLSCFMWSGALGSPSLFFFHHTL